MEEFDIHLFEKYSKNSIVNNAEKKVAINEVGIDLLAVDTIQMAKVINDYLSRIIDIIDGTKSYYQTSSGDALRNKFNEIKTYFPTVIQNIENYAYSIKKVKNNYISNTEIVLNHLNNAISSVDELIGKEGN